MAEPIDELSFRVNLDNSDLIKQTQDTMGQLEGMWEDLAKRLESSELVPETLGSLNTLIKEIEDLMGDAGEAASVMDAAMSNLSSTGKSAGQVLRVVAEALKEMNLATEELQLEATGEFLELQAVVLEKINEEVQLLRQTYVDAGKAVPIEKIDAFNKQLQKIFQLGIRQREGLDTIFERIEEKSEEARASLIRFSDEWRELDSLTAMEIATQIERMKDAFTDAGEAIPFEKIAAVENKLLKIAQLAGEDSDLGFARMGEVVEVAIERVVRLAEELEILRNAFSPEEQALLWAQIDIEVNQVAKAFEKAGKAIPATKLEKTRKELEKIIPAAANVGATFPPALEAIKEKGAEAARSVEKITDASSKLGGIMGFLQGQARRFGIDLTGAMDKGQRVLSSLSGAAQGAGISFAGMGAAIVVAAAGVTAFVIAAGLFIKFASDGIRLAIQNSEAHERFALTVRATQRALGELSPTQQEASETADQLARDWALTRVEAEQLLSTALNMTRQFEISAEQTFALADSAAALGKSAGVDSESALRSLTNFLQTGYTQGLQTLGITIDDTALRLRAWDLGLVTLNGELSEQARIIAALSIIEDESNKVRADAIEATDTFANRMKLLNERNDDAKEILGGLVSGIAEFAAELKSNVITGLINAFNILIVVSIEAVNKVIAGIKTIADTVAEAIRRGKELDFTPGTSIVEFGQEALADNLAEATERSARLLGELLGTADDVEGALNNAGQAAEKLRARVLEALGEMVKETDKLRAKFEESMRKIEQRLQDTLQKIGIDFGRKRADAALDLARDLRDIDKDTRESVEQATVEHQEKMFRMEEDHKERLRQLEIDFLFELLDAVQERDARGVLMAIRRFNKEKAQLEREKNIRTKRLKEDFGNELAELERERLIRRSERLMEFTELQDDLAKQEARKREDAMQAFENSIRDLKINHNTRMTALAQGFVDEFQLTNSSLNSIFDLMAAFLGPGGAYEQLYKYIESVAANTNLAPGGAINPFAGTGNVSVPSPINAFAGTGQASVAFRQRGGTLFATSPTAIVVGDGGPERVDITPLSASTGQPRAGFGGGGGAGGGEVNVGIMLDPGLVGEIMDETMEEMANVVTTIGRRQR